MKNTWIVGLIGLLVIVGGWWWYSNAKPSAVPAANNMGTYAYTCDNGSSFSMAPAVDMATIDISAGSQGMFTGTVTLKQDAAVNTRYTGTSGGSAITFEGAGEEVRLTVGSESAVCNPVPNAELAPWNWGDSGEGGGVRPDVVLVVGESIVGKWQDTTDAKFTREFKDGGVVVDSYDGKEQTSGTFTVFAKEKPLTVSFPLESNVVYLQLSMADTQAEKLNFKVLKLTPEELQLIYMDRGGTLTFKAVK